MRWETDVPADKSKAEIEKILARYGADQFMYGWEASRAVIGFRYSGKMARIILPLPDPQSDEFHLTPSGTRPSFRSCCREGISAGCATAMAGSSPNCEGEAGGDRDGDHHL